MKVISKMKLMPEKEFDDLVNNEIRGHASEDEAALLRSDEVVLEWKFALRRILGALKGTRAAKMEAIERGDPGAKEEYFRWASKTEWFWSAVQNRLEEATILVDEKFYSYESRISDLEEAVYA